MPEQKVTNEQRAARAIVTLDYYSKLPGMDPDSVLVDLLTDIFHLAHMENVDIGELLIIAGDHCIAEIPEEEKSMSTSLTNFLVALNVGTSIELCGANGEWHESCNEQDIAKVYIDDSPRRVRMVEWEPVSHWTDHPVYDVADWRDEVANNSTRQSYVDWVNSKIAQDMT